VIQPSIIVPDVDPHEEVFLERYVRLYAWALRLTENDRERAEDLVHDVYIQFTFARPDLASIQNLNGYLYTMLRNLHLSQLRRMERRQFRTLSIVDYDSAELGLRAADPREQITVQDQLREVCQYACLRKQTSKAGSVLILRFMHGYYPREIAQIMRCSREAVEERLRLARNEAKQYLENPAGLRFIGDPAAEKVSVPGGFARTVDEFLIELRRTIFDSRKGDCLTASQFDTLYQQDASAGIKHLSLAHIVSCHICLDEVNRRLRLPSLAERFPTDTLGTDARNKDGDGSGDGGGSSVGGSDLDLRRCRKAAREVLEHRPAELCVSVNGYVMATQSVGSDVSEQTIAINLPEKISFVEVFSEQQVRFLFLDLEENDRMDRHARIALSDDRTLEAILVCDNPWPTLQVVYSDPAQTVEAAAGAIEPNVTTRITAAPAVKSRNAGEKFRHSLERLRDWFGSLRFLLRPGTVTAALSLLLIGALLLMRLYTPPVSAAEILRRSALAEEAIANESGAVVHRSVTLEERDSNAREATVRHRLEIWQSNSRHLKVRRLFDDQNRLVAGDWAKSDGTSLVYRNKLSPQPRTAPEVAPGAVVENGELWRLDVSASAFRALIDHPEAITIQENSDTYVLAVENRVPSNSNRLLTASLTIAKAGLRAIEQKLVVARNGSEREYRFVETAFERKAEADVPAGVFEPETELLSAAGGNRTQALRSSGEAEPAPAPPSDAVASPELEIEVTYLLNRIKADLDEQVSLSRTASGTLRVEALAENEQRKSEILRALGPVRNNPAVKVEVSTVAEAVKRQPDRSHNTTTRDVEVANNPIPADSELRAYFSGRLAGREGIDAEINNYTNRVMGRSRRALLHASALKKLVARFSPEDLRGLAPDARTKWLGMIHDHALGCQREVASLKQELRMVFGGSGEPSVEDVTEASLRQAAGRLVELSYANDEAVRSAFTVSSESRGAGALKSNQFWLTLSSAEKLAAAIDRIYQQ
jgi:RNA polymerase sigma factor (sigma-70 family)